MLKKPPAVEDRSAYTDQTKVSRSNAKQIESAENEGMPVLSRSVSPEMHKDHQPAETTTLERRVLAHERILKSLIAHIAETEPRFLERLQKTYGIQIKNREQDYTETEDFADEFVRAIEETMLHHGSLGELGTNTVKAQPETARNKTIGSKKNSPDRFQIRNRNGIWQVNENGKFYGDYFHEEQAKEAVRTGIQNRTISR